MRAAVRRSVEVRDYEPRGDEDGWQEALERLRVVMQEVPSQLDGGEESA
jgi:hypothetical protein